MAKVGHARHHRTNPRGQRENTTPMLVRHRAKLRARQNTGREPMAPTVPFCVSTTTSIQKDEDETSTEVCRCRDGNDGSTIAPNEGPMSAWLGLRPPTLTHQQTVEFAPDRQVADIPRAPFEHIEEARDMVRRGAVKECRTVPGGGGPRNDSSTGAAEFDLGPTHANLPPIDGRTRRPTTTQICFDPVWS